MGSTQKKMIDPVAKALIEELCDLNRYPDERIPNIWSIIEYGKESYEIRYSRFLRWLLDPKGNHGIKDAFIKKLWRKLKEKQKGQPIDTNWSDDKTISKCEVFFKTDTPSKTDKNRTGTRRFIDILVFDDENKQYLCIELKVLSSAHSNQLKDYAEYMKAHEKYGTYKNGLLAFITPDDYKPDPKQWHEDWVCLNYTELQEILDSILKEDISKEKSIAQNKSWEYIDSFKSDLGKYIQLKEFKEKAIKLYDILTPDQVRGEVYTLKINDGNKERLINRIEEDRTTARLSKIVIRMIFNDLVDEKSQLSLEVTKNNPAIECSDFKAGISDSFENEVLEKIRISQGKGRGIALFFKGDIHAYIVFTDDVDNIQLSRPNDGKQRKGERKEKNRYKTILTFEDDVQDIKDSFDTIMPYYYKLIDEYIKSVK